MQFAFRYWFFVKLQHYRVKQGVYMCVLQDILNDYKNGMSLEKICKRYGGMSLYIPKVSPLAKENIIKEFNGANHAFLAYKYNLSQRAVREIVKRA